jgi:TolB protein
MKFYFLFIALLFSIPAHALNITITGGAEGALPIAIVPFGTAKPQPTDVAQIIRDNLKRSGRFDPLPVQSLPSYPTESQQVNYEQWRMIGSMNLVIGRIMPLNDKQVNVAFELFDVLKGVRLSGYQFNTNTDQLRRIAHQISDMIYEALIGEKGVFNTRIAFVTLGLKDSEKEYRLQIADADGANNLTILTSPEPLLSPAWSPDASRLAYVSFEGKRTAVYIQDLRSGQREVVADWKGLNTSPSWSPDGTRLAVTLSKSGNPEIYILTLANQSLQRLTNDPAIDTEAVWSPDGRTIVFTSDRGGAPQIYRVPITGGTPQRLTFQGGYNARARFAPDGKSLALLNGSGGAYRIAILDLNTRQMRTLTQTTLDESPTFAPNGSMIIYASGSKLAAVSVDGRVRQSLGVRGGLQVREPAWSPFLVR